MSKIITVTEGNLPRGVKIKEVLEKDREITNKGILADHEEL